MSGKAPFFLTGANAKIKINGRTLAFCTDLSYSIQVITQTPKTLGSYEGTSVEPLGYSVSGSFSIIRYVKNAKKNSGGDAPIDIDENDAGNGIGNWGAFWETGARGFLASNGIGDDGRPNENLNPGRMAGGTTFDIQVYQKTGTGALIGVVNIRSVRVTQADFSITKKGPTVQRFNFVALYADEDSFAADFSGKGQQF